MLPSGTHPDTPWSEVGIIHTQDLSAEEQELARQILPSDETRRQCVQEVTRESSEGLTYGEVRAAYIACLTEMVAPTGSLHPSARLNKPEVLIARMRRTLDALQRHYPDDVRMTHVSEPETAISSPDRAHQYFQAAVDDLPQEELHVLMMDVRNQPIGQSMVVRGGPSGASVDMSDLMRPVVRARAKSMIVIHNHPSGDPNPSPEDVAITRQIQQAASMFDIDFLDHIVVGRDGRYVSMNEKRLNPFKDSYEPRNIAESGTGYSPERDAGQVVQQLTLGEEWAPDQQLGFGFESSMAAEAPPITEVEVKPEPVQPELGQVHFLPGEPGDFLTEGPPAEPVELPPVEPKKKRARKSRKPKTVAEPAPCYAPETSTDPIPDDVEISVGQAKMGENGDDEAKAAIAESVNADISGTEIPEYEKTNRPARRGHGMSRAAVDRLRPKSGRLGPRGRRKKSAPAEIRRFARLVKK